MDEGGEYTERPFIQLFTDAILLCEQAESLPHLAASRHSALVRASIIASILSVEAAANSLMAPVLFPQRLLEIIDKSQPLDKFEFVLHAVQPNKKFDRGSKHAQEIRELFNVRNGYVHPRTRTRLISYKELDARTTQIQKTEERSQYLDIPTSPEDWGVKDAQRASKACADFLDYFVIELCELTPQQTIPILLSTVSIEEKSSLVLSKEYREILLRAADRWKIDLRMIKRIVEELDPDILKTPKSQRNLVFKYSWGLGGVQLHEQKKAISIGSAEVSSLALSQVAQEFFLWFEEAEAQPYGRGLILFEIFSEDESRRYAKYRVYLPQSVEGRTEEPRHRPIGTVEGVTQQGFINGVYGAEKLESGSVVLRFKDENGKTAKLEVPADEVMVLRQLIQANSRADWEAAPPFQHERVSSGEISNEFRIETVEIVAYDPTSKTAFIVFNSASGKKVQLNMNPGQLLALDEAVERVAT